MKKIEFGNDGHPPSHQDIYFLQTAVRFAFEALGTSMQGAGAILHGCEVTRDMTHLHVAAGVLIFDGEILFFGGGSLMLLYEPGAYFGVAQSNEAPSVIQKDLNVYWPYQARYATLAGNIAPGGNFQYFDQNRIEYKDWLTVTPEVGFDFTGIAAGPPRLSYKTHNREMIVRGRIRVGAAWADGAEIALFEIPDILRPKVLTEMNVVGDYPIKITAGPASQHISVEQTSGGVIGIGTEITIGDFRYRLD